MEEENLSHVWPIVEGLTKNRSKQHAKAEIEKLQKEHNNNILKFLEAKASLARQKKEFE